MIKYLLPVADDQLISNAEQAVRNMLRKAAANAKTNILYVSTVLDATNYCLSQLF